MAGWAKSLKWLTVGVSFMAASMVVTAQEQLAEGKEYQRLKAPQTVESGAKIEVIEFFSYGCPHCRDLEEFLGPWAKKMPADVAFKRVPVAFQPAWEPIRHTWGCTCPSTRRSHWPAGWTGPPIRSLPERQGLEDTQIRYG